MRTTKFLLLTIALASSIFGCAPNPPSVIGRWQGKADLSNVDQNNAAAQMAQNYQQAFAPTLEFEANNRFTMIFPVATIKGRYMLDGLQVECYPETVNDLTLEQLKAKAGNGLKEFEKDIDRLGDKVELKVNRDGNSLEGSINLPPFQGAKVVFTPMAK